MSHEQIEQKAKEIIADILCVNIEDVKPECKLGEDLGADQLDEVEIIMGFEDYFGIQISEEDAEGLVTVKDCLDYLKKHL